MVSISTVDSNVLLAWMKWAWKSQWSAMKFAPSCLYHRLIHTGCSCGGVAAVEVQIAFRSGLVPVVEEGRGY